MFFQNLSYFAVAMSAVVTMGLGFLWYSSWAFGKRWMKEMDLTPEGLEELKKKNGAKGMARTYLISLVLAIVTAFIFSALLNSLIVVGIWGLLLLALYMWLGFSMPIAANYLLYGRDSFALFAINSGYQLVSLILIALVVGIFG